MILKRYKVAFVFLTLLTIMGQTSYLNTQKHEEEFNKNLFVTKESKKEVTVSPEKISPPKQVPAQKKEAELHHVPLAIADFTGSWSGTLIQGYETWKLEMEFKGGEQVRTKITLESDDRVGLFKGKIALIGKNLELEEEKQLAESNGSFYRKKIIFNRIDKNKISGSWFDADSSSIDPVGRVELVKKQE